MDPQARRLAKELTGLLNSADQDGVKMWDRQAKLTKGEKDCVKAAVASVLGLAPPYARELTGGYDLQLVTWVRSDVPTSGNNRVAVGADNKGLLHVRIFDAGGNLVVDTTLPDTQAGPISTLKKQLPDLQKPPHALTGAEKALVLAEVSAIVGLPLTGHDLPYASGYYFNVADQLAKLPPGWLHCESRWRNVPRNACYRAACGGKFVWVGPEGMEAFSDFVLIIQKIARTNLSTAYFPQTQTRKIQKNFTFVEAGKTYYGNATVFLDEKGILTTGENTPAIPVKQRIDNVGSNSDLKSIINAAAKSSTP